MPIEQSHNLLLIIDSLRADHPFGPDRSAKTPGRHAQAESRTRLS